MCTPFAEDPETTDVAKRVLRRQIEWSILEMYHVTALGKFALPISINPSLTVDLAQRRTSLRGFWSMTPRSA